MIITTQATYISHLRDEILIVNLALVKLLIYCEEFVLLRVLSQRIRSSMILTDLDLDFLETIVRTDIGIK